MNNKCDEDNKDEDIEEVLENVSEDIPKRRVRRKRKEPQQPATLEIGTHPKKGSVSQDKIKIHKETRDKKNESNE